SHLQQPIGNQKSAIKNVMTLVMKFGGTSVADASAFDNVSRIVRERITSRPIVVVSAMSGTTDALIRSFEIAQAGDSDTALASLFEILERHEAVAASMLDGEEKKEFIIRL